MAELPVPEDMREWLRRLGLERHADLFAQQEIDFDVLPDLTDADLQKLGLPMGARKKLLRAIDGLKQNESRSLTGADVRHARRCVDQPERRQLTVMFCDLVGSTALSRRLDPEDMRDVIRAYQGLVARQVTRFEGHVADFLGDGIKVYFGFPSAQENSAELAIRTAKAISDSIGALDTAAKEPLSVRIGIATGLVVVGDLIGEGAAQEEMVVGETPNLAARLQSLAEPGATVIAAATRHLVGGLFDLQTLGLHQFKGFDEPIDAWRVLRESKIASRFDALHATDAVPLAGRDAEMDLLDARWALARQDKGQVVLLYGEAGIGKSRIAQEFSARVARESPAILTYQCWPHFASSSLHPFMADLKRNVGAVPEQRRSDGVDNQETDRAGVPEHPDLPLSYEDASNQPKEKFFDIFVEYVRQLSRDRSVLFLVEDAHWADPSSLELLDILIERTANCRVLILVTSRPGFEVVSRNQDQITLVTLNRCDRDAVMMMIDHLAAGKNMPITVRNEIMARTDGVPLFVEELTIAILESGNRFEKASGPSQPASADIPATLYDCLMVRLDRLGPAKKIAQLASAIGRTFLYDVLHVISELDHENLDASLKDLVAAEIVYPLQGVDQRGYIFKHALVQDAAYQSLLAQQRRAIHASIADVFLEKFSALCERQPELPAHHLTLARQDVRAIQYWQLAGRRAARMSSYIEASNHLNRALDILRSLPETNKDTNQELDLMVSLATVQLATKGYGAPDVAAAFSEAKKRCGELGEIERLMTVSFGEWACVHHYQPFGDIIGLARRLRRAAKSSDAVGSSLMGDRVLGNSLLFSGRFARARIYLHRVASEYDEVRDRKVALRYGLDLLTASLSQLLMAEWALGSGDEADATGKRAIAYAEHIEHGNSLAHALIHAGLFLEQFQNRPKQILRHAERLHEISEGGGFRMFLAWCRILEGWALFELGDQSKGIAQMQDGISRAQETGSVLYQPYFLTLLAQCHGLRSDFDKGLESIARALQFVNDRGERWYAAEAYRVKGELLMRGLGDDAGAVEALRLAHEIARQQRNEPFKQRVRVSLAALDIVPS